MSAADISKTGNEYLEASAVQLVTWYTHFPHLHMNEMQRLKTSRWPPKMHFGLILSTRIVYLYVKHDWLFTFYYKHTIKAKMVLVPCLEFFNASDWNAIFMCSISPVFSYHAIPKLSSSCHHRAFLPQPSHPLSCSCQCLSFTSLSVCLSVSLPSHIVIYTS